jgi:hypothetical protein
MLNMCCISKLYYFLISKPSILVSLRGSKLLKNVGDAYLTESVSFTSFKGARRPLAREPGYLKDDTNAANLSIDFSAMPLYAEGK